MSGQICLLSQWSEFAAGRQHDCFEGGQASKGAWQPTHCQTEGCLPAQEFSCFSKGFRRLTRSSPAHLGLGQPVSIQYLTFTWIVQVFEYMESDLEMVIKNSATILSPADVKAYMQMLLLALKECHEQWIVHRDIKPNNFLVSSTGNLLLHNSNQLNYHVWAILYHVWAITYVILHVSWASTYRTPEGDRLWPCSCFW